ncbi:LysR family transcriptional regulator [Achromobacter arsenitoxydans]|uniref:LysR family transcriptional regulator n=1 Tax=Achromobacter arsenitoxydans SY8 TaxID=477184 RepID=H0F1N3_9BURK|nr:LysR family transcriptional regulator [Achromobacter arsenitoxydans]EHK67911.1 LysR family transcriptional regulator [Achromobacter arsenitoxydans SY8]
MMPADFDLGLLRSFATVIRSGNISRAAKLLGRTQPAISQHIQRLEERLGHTLLVRTNVGVAPTASGERLMELAERILALTDGIPAALGEQYEKTQLRIGLSEESVGHQRMAVLHDLKVIHPSLSLEIVHASGQVIAQGIEDGIFDLALVDPQQTRAAPLETRDYPLTWAAAPFFDPALRPLPLVLWREPCAWRDAVIALVEKAGIEWILAFEADALALLHGASRSGIGLTIAPAKRAVPGLVSLNGKHALPSPPSMTLGVYASPRLPSGSLTERIKKTLWLLAA